MLPTADFLRWANFFYKNHEVLLLPWLFYERARRYNGGDMNMTTEQEKQIVELRRRGFGYIRIGRALGLSNSTVASYCQRHGIKEGYVQMDRKVEIEGNYCKQCGIPIVQTPHKRKRKFCSDLCRNEWWKNHKGFINRKKYSRVCKNCGKKFETHYTAIFCSRACYIEWRKSN